MLWAEHVQWNKEDFVNTNEVLTERRWESSRWRKTGRMRRGERRSPRSLLRGGQAECEKIRSSSESFLLCSFSEWGRCAKGRDFALGREDEPHDTAAASEVRRLREDSPHSSGQFSPQPQRSRPSSPRLRTPEPRVTPNLFRMSPESKIVTQFNLPLFLIHLSLFSINESWVSHSVLSQLITCVNEISRKLSDGPCGRQTGQPIATFQTSTAAKERVMFRCLREHTHLQMLHSACLHVENHTGSSPLASRDGASASAQTRTVMNKTARSHHTGDFCLLRLFPTMLFSFVG